jgi:hypothetical protein
LTHRFLRAAREESRMLRHYLPTLCAAAAVIALGGTTALGLGVVKLADLGLSPAIAAAPPAIVELGGRARPRCVHCGWIESRHEVLPGIGDAPGASVHEYTLRMDDGTSTIFREPQNSGWRVGERLQMIDGFGTPTHGIRGGARSN